MATSRPDKEEWIVICVGGVAHRRTEKESEREGRVGDVEDFAPFVHLDF
jgi:hypothetical protein